MEFTMSAVTRTGLHAPRTGTPMAKNGAAASKRKPGAAVQTTMRVQPKTATLVPKAAPQVDKLVWKIFYDATSHLAEMDDNNSDETLRDLSEYFKQEIGKVQQVVGKNRAMRYRGVPIKITTLVTELLGLVKGVKIPIHDKLSSPYPLHGQWKAKAIALQAELDKIKPPTSCSEACVIL